MSPDEVETLTRALEGDRLVMVIALALFALAKIVETVVQVRKNGNGNSSSSTNPTLTRLVADVGGLKGQMEIVLQEIRRLKSSP